MKMKLAISPEKRFKIAEKIVDILLPLQKENKGYYTNDLVSVMKLCEILGIPTLTKSQQSVAILGVVTELEYVTKLHKRPGIRMVKLPKKRTHLWCMSPYNTDNMFFDEKHQRLVLLANWLKFKFEKTRKCYYKFMHDVVSKELLHHHESKPEDFVIQWEIHEKIKTLTESMPLDKLIPVIREIVSEELRKILSEFKISISI
jgi:hypothetical protein